jgi:hypothetical protein
MPLWCFGFVVYSGKIHSVRERTDTATELTTMLTEL